MLLSVAASTALNGWFIAPIGFVFTKWPSIGSVIQHYVVQHWYIKVPSSKVTIILTKLWL
ncbi:hypothetical protein F9C07_6273 [Aspergillus flavus]|uniref:Uncharacterized protein n=1 Tax=Aspergillus flavus (strain ATCC 200026 / FGSC A1120 / IAM 13836 / NRRL 3357 / JCM 12722 / SRRC 167) TaxID=332952 RepID=A0A7U2QV97_ASPFN|nr:hypothetical protein F9C07_6273 [Aspergillus flavus]